MALTRITNTPMAYAWGRPDGVARALGHTPTGGPEAELWLGAHPSSPSRRADSDDGWSDLAAWETSRGVTLPYLLKLLAADAPLSLQAHPTPLQARIGFDREEAAGIDRGAAHRNYKDPHAKPELIMAVEDGFEALCGFRPVAETLSLIDAGAAVAPDPGWDRWRVELRRPDGVRAAFSWLLSGDALVAGLVEALAAAGDADPGEFRLAAWLSGSYPGDPGVAVAQMLNHVTLAAGEALWLPAGNIHAYLSGLGIELMGPSDNVLRGGLTPKHVDKDELQTVLDFTPQHASRLDPLPVGDHVLGYRPSSVPSGADVPFELLVVTGPADVPTGSAAVGLVVSGAFSVIHAGEAHHFDRGESFFVDDADDLAVDGAGMLVVAHAR